MNGAGGEKVQRKIEHIGNDKTPILTLDSFDMFTAPLRNAAYQATFAPDVKTYYPGVRAPIPKEAVVAVLRGLFRQLYPVFDIPRHLRLKPRDANFSLITRAPSALGDLQRIPHFDTSNPYFFALLLYLNPGPHGGTGFFRHKSTGYERVSEERAETYFSVADQFLQQQGGPSAGYVKESRDDYELFHEIEYRQHRLTVYPGNVLHSILVDEQADISADPKTGRLTANLFFEFA
ncbi:DUF6445 family protein [Microbulbifer sp.]|uniref:DUF6445 family protein n=1 Tax=Microbulbifer sp. TaxID=1908541 RepID=UPI0025884AAC|nr:DUF6445 family protein [Microbulbifer sp.]